MKRMTKGFVRFAAGLVAAGLVTVGGLGTLFAQSDGGLAAAALRGDLSGCRRYVESGAPVDAPASSDTLRRTPLMLAVRSGSVPVVRFLLESGAKVDARDGRRATALLYAAERGRDGIAALLLSAGASVDARDRFGDWPLLAAVREGNQAVVELLLAAGADTAKRSRYTDMTAEELARSLGRTSLEKLLSRVASGDCFSLEGSQPLLTGAAE
ncbi:ankyrin repeat domain-containing protein [Salinispira pacifica]